MKKIFCLLLLPVLVACILCASQKAYSAVTDCDGAAGALTTAQDNLKTCVDNLSLTCAVSSLFTICNCNRMQFS